MRAWQSPALWENTSSPKVVHKGRRGARMRYPGPLTASAVRRRVGEVEDARAEGLRVHELQRFLIASVLKQALPAAQDDRVDHEPELIEEVFAQQRPDEGAAAHDRDVLARLLLELGDLLRDVVLDQRRVLPLEGLLEGL